jgi:heme oxygenase
MNDFETRSERTDLFEMLKRETAAIHEKVMDESWSRRLLSADYTLPEYARLLQKYYGFYFPLETLLLALPVPVFHPSRAKHSLLREDLRVLSPHWSFEAAICRKLPAVMDVPSALGICYVLEGATLGGQIIAKHLKISLGLKDQDGLSFFRGYGPETAKMWNAFKANTRDIVRTPQEFTGMLDAALRTFDSLSEWMEAS